MLCDLALRPPSNRRDHPKRSSRTFLTEPIAFASHGQAWRGIGIGLDRVAGIAITLCPLLFLSLPLFGPGFGVEEKTGSGSKVSQMSHREKGNPCSVHGIPVGFQDEGKGAPRVNANGTRLAQLETGQCPQGFPRRQHPVGFSKHDRRRKEQQRTKKGGIGQTNHPRSPLDWDDGQGTPSNPVPDF